MKIILGSASPRRKELLQKIIAHTIRTTPTFEIKVAAINETPHPNEDPLVYVNRMAFEKAQAILPLNLSDYEARHTDLTEFIKAFKQSPHKPHSLALTADTIVTLDQTIYGKPRNQSDAERILHELSSKSHNVITAFVLALLFQEDIMIYQSFDRSEVSFKKLTPIEIETYCQSQEPLDKAGAYAIQGKARAFVDQIKGSFDNVVGLPTEHLLKIFKLCLSDDE